MSDNTRDYLLQVTIGPVQDFISAARRTRDLWFGSTMLSELSKAAAQAVNAAGARLIFPAPLDESQLRPGSELNVANVILAEVPSATEDQLQTICADAKKAVIERLKKFADEPYRKLCAVIEPRRWKHQLADAIEIYSAWTPFTPDTYQQARARAGRLIAARKNIRDFIPAHGEAGVPKSSLDGLRESVFRQKLTADEIKKVARRGIRLKENEALDAIGLIKRYPAKDDERFPSISRVAVDPWIRGRGREYYEQHKSEIDECCEQLVRAGALSRVSDPYKAFPYEGVALLPSRYPAMLAETEDSKEADEALEKLKKLVPTDKRLRLDEPYLVALSADGDRMGATLSDMKTPQEHRTFSSTLAKFAGEARKVIAEHFGVCIYTGGDDVLALMPIDTALACTRALHDLFARTMKDYADGDRAPSLSVGIAVVHAMEDLEDILTYARKAEKAAKKGVDGKAAERGQDRNGLAISVISRGNSPVTIREQWKDEGGTALGSQSLDQRLDWWAECFARDEIPNKFPYELRANIDFYRNWSDTGTLKQALRDDAKRIFGRKDVKLDKECQKRVNDYLDSGILTDADSIARLSDELIVAQWLAFGKMQAAFPAQKERA